VSFFSFSFSVLVLDAQFATTFRFYHLERAFVVSFYWDIMEVRIVVENEGE